MKVEEVIREKPHLKSPLELYDKVKNFVEFCKNEKERLNLDTSTDLFDVVLRNFSSLFSIPYDSISFLKDEILRAGIDPVKIPSSLLLMEIQTDDLSKEEISRMFFILSKPFFVFLRKDGVEASFMETGKCPICGTDSSISMITGNNERVIICPMCEHGGSFYRIGCPYCFNRNPDRIEMLLDDEEIRIEHCLECSTYVKSFRENHFFKYKNPFLIDIVSLPLDIIAQKRGFIRRSPNYIGLRIIE